VLRRARDLARSEGGVSAIEFAIGAPMALVLIFAGVDTGRYALATRSIDRVVATIGQMASVNTTGTMSPAELQFYEDSTFGVFPLVLRDSSQLGRTWSADMPITVSSVRFATVGPATVATVAWSAGPGKRACVVPLTAVPDTAAPSPTTLAQDAFGTGTLLVVDASFTFRPTIAVRFLPNVTIARSFYVQPRYVPAVAFSGPASATVNQC
jgi:hypothetical protein